ncbi:family 16 glycosylhydrolase [Roseomonas sp. OT10]|uniref:family 16 glycosylhydrolase n=1 Tax=Roseomonas cutis TaxID=2897332 RepID=UPI001E65C569|nr:family 16 glycosylhydrolase [Roseomonas sp. OT10]UFN47598.1 family 16 glycosylhydrolase [Roseomonas sp. OT10]
MAQNNPLLYATDYQGNVLPLSAAPTRTVTGIGKGETVTAGDGPYAVWSRGGASTLVGGQGDDTFYVSDARDIVLAQDGYVHTIVSWYATEYTLPDNIRNLTVRGNNFWASGNDLDNVIRADNASQTLYGGKGNDVLNGGGGRDIFAIAPGDGHDVIVDFAHGSSILRLNGFTGLQTLADVQAAMEQVGDDVRLTLGEDQSILFRNQTVNAFTAADFFLPLDPSRMTLTFAEEFNQFDWSSGGQGSAWRTSWDYGRWMPWLGDQQYYSDATIGVDPFTVQDGVLTITAAPGPNPVNTPYNSGMINNQESFAQTYGYFEMRVDLPAGQGLWPAFWLLPVDDTWPPEIDILEMLGQDPTTIHFNAHYTGGRTGTQVRTEDMSEGFHTFGMLWGPDWLTWYVDGDAYARIATPAEMHKAMHIITNLSVGGTWVGRPDETTQFPAEMHIDYIRAYAYQDPESLAPLSGTPAPPAVPVAPVVTAPGTLTATAGRTLSFGNALSVADPDAGESLTVTLTTGFGVLQTSANGAGVTEAGDGTSRLTLTGTAEAINAELASLTYAYRNHGIIPGSTVQDSVTVLVEDAAGHQDVETVVVPVTAQSGMKVVEMGDTPSRKAANGNTLFVFDEDIPSGGLTHILNFRTAAQHGGSGDMLLFKGFGGDATLQFHHIAWVGNQPNPLMQYYTIESDSGQSTLFMVQLSPDAINPDGSYARLGIGDYAFL